MVSRKQEDYDLKVTKFFLFVVVPETTGYALLQVFYCCEFQFPPDLKSKHLTDAFPPLEKRSFRISKHSLKILFIDLIKLANTY